MLRVVYFLGNRHSELYISKEIVQSGDTRKFSKVEVEEHLARALKKPTDKLSNSHNFMPTGRFWDDYIRHETRKWLHRLAAVGFTLNPEHCAGEARCGIYCTERNSFHYSITSIHILQE